MPSITNGGMKSRETVYVSFLESVLADLNANQCRRDLALDIAYIRRRYQHEGEPFLTQTLPKLGKALYEGLEHGSLTVPSDFRRIRGGNLPRFLNGFFRQVFSLDGNLLDSPDPFSVQEILQVCMVFYKLELPYSPEKENAVISNFVETEAEMKNFDLPTDSTSVAILDHASDLISKVLSRFCPKDIIPKHGPGAVATGETLNGKYAFKRKYQRLHEKYPYYEYFSPSMGKLSFEDPWYRNLSMELNPIAKVVLVPKDSRGPRLISMEPLEIQWIQQGLFHRLVPLIESHSLTRGKVNFTDQSINQNLARQASIDRSYSTLDLKDASDRVSLVLFRRLFPETVVEHFEACRSVATELPNGSYCALSKFAPMGSALCFPVMALTIWALSVAAVRHAPKAGAHVYVYGDDLIVPNHVHAEVVECLTRFGLRINTNKSFTAGFFRESCGGDFFHGTDVKPIRWKHAFNRKDNLSPECYSGLLSLSESLFNRGLWGACGFIRRLLRSKAGALHWTTTGSSGLYCPDPSVCASRNRETHRSTWNMDLQREEFFAICIKQPAKVSKLTEHSRLLKGLVNPSGRWINPQRVTPRRRSVLSRGKIVV